MKIIDIATEQSLSARELRNKTIFLVHFAEAEEWWSSTDRDIAREFLHSEAPEVERPSSPDGDFGTLENASFDEHGEYREGKIIERIRLHAAGE